MDFSSLLNAAQKNDDNPKREIKYYSTKFEPPKKEERSKELSANIKKFLARKEAEEKKRAIEAKNKREELLALRSQDKKATRRVSVMLKRTKSANKSVIQDAVDNDNTAVTLAGPSQPDEDDYGYVSQEASAFYNKMMAKYSTLPDEPKLFSSAKKNTNINLNGTKDRVRAALLKEQEEAMLPHRRKRKSKHENGDEKDEPKSPDTYHEEIKEEKPKPKPKVAAPPPINFQDLLKIAEKKQFEPIVIETKKKSEEDDLLMTKRQRREYEKEKQFREEREKRREAMENPKGAPPNKIPKLSNSSNANGSFKIPKPVSDNRIKTEQKPATNNIKKPTSSPSERNVKFDMTAQSSRDPKSKLRAELEKPKERMKEGSSNQNRSTSNNRTPDKQDIRSGEVKKIVKPDNRSSDINKSKSSISNNVKSKLPESSKQLNSKQKQLPPSNARPKDLDGRPKQLDGRPKQLDGRPKQLDGRPKQLDGRPKLLDGRPKQLDGRSKELDGRPRQLDGRPRQLDGRPKQFPPSDVRPKQFPPADLKPKQFPPSDVRPKKFPPSDVRPRQFPPGDIRRRPPPKKPPMGHKRRILDDDDSEYDSEMDDFIDDGPEDEQDYSKYISEIFGYDKSRYRDVHEDDDGMESSFSQMMKEEYISTKIGLMEDLEDMKQEAIDKKKKEARKKQMTRR